MSSSGAYKIFAVNGPDPLRPTSIDDSGLPYEEVRLNKPEKFWRLTELGVRQPNHTIQFNFALEIGEYRATGVITDEQIGDKVVASKKIEDNVEWRATYREGQKAWTIERVDQPGKGWQALLDEKSPYPHIVIREIKEPFETQLFQFERVSNY